MADKKNPIAAMIVAKAKPAPKDDMYNDGDEGDEGDKEGQMAAAEDIFQAIDKRDPEALRQALSAFIQMC
jgi:DNA-binding FadR family transcriptional regulator